MLLHLAHTLANPHTPIGTQSTINNILTDTAMTLSKKTNQSSRGNGNGKGTRKHRNIVNPKEVPMLRWGLQNNFRVFRKKFASYAMGKYGEVACYIIRLDENPMPKEPKKEDVPVEDPQEIQNKIAAYKRYVDRKIEVDRQLPRFYSCLMSFLSQNSLDAVKSEDEFEEIDANHDAHRLWKLIRITHRENSCKAENKEVTKAKVRCAYHNVVQSANESIVAFRERFDDALWLYNEFDNPKMNERDIAMDFLLKLDDARYLDFKIGLVNNVNKGLLQWPGTVNDIFQMAKNHIVSFKSHIDENSGCRMFDIIYADDVRVGKTEKNRAKSAKLVKGENQKKVTCWECGEVGHYKAECSTIEEL